MVTSRRGSRPRSADQVPLDLVLPFAHGSGRWCWVLVLDPESATLLAALEPALAARLRGVSLEALAAELGVSL